MQMEPRTLTLRLLMKAPAPRSSPRVRVTNDLPIVTCTPEIQILPFPICRPGPAATWNSGMHPAELTP